MKSNEKRRDFLKRVGMLAAVSVGGLGVVKKVAPAGTGAEKPVLPAPKSSQTLKAGWTCREGVLECDVGKI